MTAVLTRIGAVVVPPGPPDPEPLRGDPAAALSSARRCLASAQLLHDVHARLTDRTATLESHRQWCGTASGAFQRSISATASWFDNAGRALAVVAAALLTYARAVDQAGAQLRQAQLRTDELRRRRAELLAEIERGQRAGLGAGLLFDLATFDPATVTLQQRADQLAAEIGDVRTATDEATALTDRAERTAAAAFDEAAAMTFAARERALARGARSAGDGAATAGSRWLDVSELIGLGLADLVGAALDTAQGGLDPVTDAAEAAALARTGEVASRLGGRFAVDEAVAGAETAAVGAAEREALAAVEQGSGDDWLAAARAKLPPEWGDGIPGKYDTGVRWIEPEGKGTYLRIDPGRPEHGDPLQQIDHVHVRMNGRKIGRDGAALPGKATGLSAIESANLAELEHVPLSEWLTWKEWWRP